MVCPRCNQPVEANAAFCGNCGNQLAPVQALGATVADATELIAPERMPRNTPEQRFSASRPPRVQTPPGQAYNSLSPLSQRETISQREAVSPYTPTAAPTPPPAKPQRPNRKRIAFIAIILALLVIGLSAGVFTLLQKKPSAASTKGATTAAAPTVTGSVFFSSSPSAQDQTDTVKINVSGLSAPPQGMEYDAWLRNAGSEQSAALGKLSPPQDQGQGFSVTFTNKGHNLFGEGNQLLVTQEQSGASQPTGKVLLTSTFPPLAYVHIKHLLFQFPTTPGNIGLLVGLIEQARQVSAQALLLKGAAGSGNPTAVTCAAQSLINIVEGRHGQHHAVLPFACTGLNVTLHGDGFGILGQNGYSALAAAHASLAATTADTTDTIKIHAHHVEIALTNINGWMTSIDNDAQALLNNPGDQGKVQEIVTLAERSVNGIDLDNDEHVDPVPGEAGAITAFIHGQLMAQLALKP